MKTPVLPLLLAACLLTIGCTNTASYSKDSATRRTATSAGRRVHNVRTTAYCRQESGCHVNALGQKLATGPAYSAAADWSRYPLGTVFRIAETGRTYVVDDYGSALVGTDTIDLFVPSASEMNQWGVRRVHIDILQEGSYQESLQTLSPRRGAGYVWKMVQSLKSKVS